MLSAWHRLHKIRRDKAALYELPHAQFQALFANANRDPKKGKPFSAGDFCVFKSREDTETAFPPEVAAIALELRHENRCPGVLLTCWSHVLTAAKEPVDVPSIRAWKSDDNRVWVFAPRWEGSNVRGFVAVDGNVHGDVVLRDIDRPLLTYTAKIPQNNSLGWLQSGLLLLLSN